MSELFSEIETVDCPLPEQQRHGEKPRLEWLPVESLRVDSNYQRPILSKGRQNIARIVSDFSWSRFSPLVVTPIVKSLYAVIDGQHRAAAAKRLGIAEVPCQVVAVNPNEAAAIFSTINGNVTPMTPQYIYKAALAAKEAWALAIDRISREAGLDVLTYHVQISKQKPRQTMMIGTIRNRLERYGAEIVGLALEGMMASAKADRPGFARALALDAAIAKIHATPGAMANRAAVKIALAAIDYDAMSRSVVTLPPSRSTISKPQRAAAGLSIVNAKQTEKILDLHGRHYRPSQIAAAMKIPYAEVERVIEGAKK